MSEPLPAEVTPVVLWEDAHGLAVNKPAGWLSQGPAGSLHSVEEWVRRYLQGDQPQPVFQGTVHRLDRPVSGVMLWAKNPRAARRWADQFAERQASKEYWALVPHRPDVALPGTWEDGLARPNAEGRAVVHPVGHPETVLARTRVEPGQAGRLRPGLLWLRLYPETGRTHQLRAQASARLGPIVGDATYGSDQPFPAGIALHARRLEIRHPVTRQPLRFEAPLPESWRGYLDL